MADSYRLFQSFFSFFFFSLVFILNVFCFIIYLFALISFFTVWELHCCHQVVHKGTGVVKTKNFQK